MPSNHLELAKICQWVHDPDGDPPCPIDLKAVEQVTYGVCQVDYLQAPYRATKVNCLCFRGSKDPADFIIDADALLIKCDYGGMVHQGFSLDWDAVKCELPVNSSDPIIFCGHSLGGAVATLGALSWCAGQVLEVVTFGCPRVGDSGFVEAYTPYVPQTTRYMWKDDPVTLVPFVQWGYRHVKTPRRWNGTEWQDGQGMFRAMYNMTKSRSVLLSWLDQHRIENYIEALETIT